MAYNLGMSDVVLLEGKEYISSKKAAESSGYAQDYIGQLARKGLIEAQRVGGLWYVSMASLTGYKSNAEKYVPQQPERAPQTEPESLISFDGRDHISAARAAKITGYHQDYVGQLARSGAIMSRQVGNRWYVDREAILGHKNEKDRLLGAVQAQSVGIVKANVAVVASTSKQVSEGLYSGSGPYLTYTKGNGDLLPALEKHEREVEARTELHEREFGVDEEHVIPIRTAHSSQIQTYADNRGSYYQDLPAKPHKARKGRGYGMYGKLAAAALTIVIVLSFGFVTLDKNSVFSLKNIREGSLIQGESYSAAAASAARLIKGLLGDLLTKELIYKRGW